MDYAIRYGGRAAGAYLAYKYGAKHMPGGTVGFLAAIVLGWLAGGYVTDQIAARVR